MKTLKQIYLSIGLLCYLPVVLASQDTGTYGWDKFLVWLANELKSNVVLGIGIVVIILCGVLVAFGDFHGGGKKALAVGVGIGVALSASSILTNAFGTGAMIPHFMVLGTHG